ncbi:hypothetical protein ABTF26_19990, partial [Acinetobacter baumannii]
RDRTSDPWSKASVVLSSLETGGMKGRYDPELRRMGLEAPRTLSERLSRRVVRWALAEVDRESAIKSD